MNEQETQKKYNTFEEKVLPVLYYVGAIGAAVMSVAYIILVVVLIFGFKAEKTLKTTIFAIVSALVGFVIMQFLKYQGVSFAEQKRENVPILEKYYGTKTKDKKNHSMTYFWLTSATKDLLIKAGSVALTSIGLIYLIIEGSRDYSLIALGLVNLLMFISFGFLALVKAYNYFNRTYIEYIKEKLSEVEKEESLNGRRETLS